MTTQQRPRDQESGSHGQPIIYSVHHNTQKGNTVYEDPEYIAWCAAFENACHATVSIGAEDSAACDIPATTPHTTHDGPTSLGGRASWSGGGYCAGDPLPVRNLTMYFEEATL